MPLGDSLTKGCCPVPPPACDLGYRYSLYRKLSQANHVVNFVGSQTHPQDDCASSDIPFDFDREHEGYYDKTADWVRDRVRVFLQANPAKIVLLHIGTNDLRSGQEPSDIVMEVSQLLDEIDQYSSDVTVILALIINKVPISSIYTHYNTQLTAMAETRIANGDKLLVVDMENGADIDYHLQDADGDFVDAFHPNESGYTKMANVWYDRLTQLLDSPLAPNQPPYN
ncbi:GDSL-type esterase/lipase family protein [Candidatus Nitrospira salsa]